ncbi:hypothetical protein BJP41_05960 [Candidatus Williamhamiltonella defendens]|uniref:HTH cro/C1-type domain-containing protein n=1 Tax=Candidatus Williamhamiltonella defendens TaxID=138072 RepID=A0A2D3SW66_9ENTR|nr:hypothetical protein BJP44_03450 [Candidatus Hamiltonella defensa]ATW29948.1 hypothetical protein BJP41_05960 [Candidatus Hamiltonella defensa]ATW31920.1 hypothetical protein BJP42_06055 [Candidatus Hamiltonella defensa]ATW34018.1 hypothetical protein BJP43_06835 [Candidatus Hamiltonella defensa]AYB48826.1 transcriptional regulator [Candidatus Hamiltonella defensa]
MKTRCIEHKIAIETIGARLKKAREASKLTQQTVADRLCLRLSTIQKIEENNLTPSFFLLLSSVIFVLMQNY